MKEPRCRQPQEAAKGGEPASNDFCGKLFPGCVGSMRSGPDTAGIRSTGPPPSSYNSRLKGS